MDFTYSTEQSMLKDSVDRFIQDKYGFEARMKLVGADEGFSRENWKTFAELGWLGVSLPEEVGGFGGTGVETMIIMEGLGRALAVEPYLATVVLGAGLVDAGGSEEQKKAILPAVVEGDCLLAFGYAERSSRFNPAHVEAAAEKSGDGYVLNGTKIVVYHAAAADRIIVSARTGGEMSDRDGISLFILDRDAPGLERRDYRTVDGLRASDLTLENVRAGKEALLGGEGEAYPLIEAALDAGIAAVCAEAVGAMEATNEITNEYLKTRKQFGAPIGKFQVLQHRMVDMFMEAEQSRSMAVMAAMKLSDEAARTRAMSAAKARIGKAAKFIGAQSVQLHGGMGMTEEYVVGHYYKRLSMIESLFGNVDYHLKRFAELAD